jgi:50S ribosomal protein L16 3-hydroxylase
MQLNNFDTDRFLRDYWQKKPLLIRNPWTQWANPLAPDDLAGLACEAEVESRLIVQTGTERAVENGPFAEARFAQLEQKCWTLLVQAVDHHVPEVSELLAPFRFIPNWRIDDVMVSYATDGGGVGPHFDQYDVFLIQGLGTRRWRVGQRCDAQSALLPNDDLRLLADFEATDEWLLEPGDILYVPPGIAHDGVAVGDDCMTYSIGFRAPSRSELLGHYVDDVLDGLSDDDRYADPDLAAQTNSGEISAAALGALHAMITEKLGDKAAFARWFGTYNSTRKYPEIDWSPDEPAGAEQLRSWIANGEPLTRNPASRFSFMRQDGDAVLLFVDGECFETSGKAAAFAEILCAQDDMIIDVALTQSKPIMALLVQLCNQGSIAFAQED